MTAAMDTTSFSSRRQAATSLPQFHLPTPANVPSMPPKPFAAASPLTSSFSQPASSANSILTPPLGVTGDGLSPLSSANAGSSQASGAATGLAGYYGHSHGSWPTPGNSNSSYTFGSTNQQGQSLTQQGYGGRGVYGQSASLPYGSRNPQSPTTGIDGLTNPSYDHTHQPYSTTATGGADAGGGGSLGGSNAGLGMGPSPGNQGGGGGGGSGILPGVPGGSGLPGTPSASSGLHRHSQSSQGGILGSQTQSNPQPPTTASPGGGPGPIDPYSQSRSPPSQSYYTPVSTSTSSTFQSYASPPQGSSVHPPASSTGPQRPLGSMIPPSGMAPPQPYRGYAQYPQMSHIGGPIMSNMGNPGGQMSLVTGMNMHPSYGGQMTHRLYGPGSHQQQQERPFSCDQCTQSFNRNHDLKRHKRIHLAVKPFPCSSCDKSFSRKDALKVSVLILKRVYDGDGAACLEPAATCRRIDTERFEVYAG